MSREAKASLLARAGTEEGELVAVSAEVVDTGEEEEEEEEDIEEEEEEEEDPDPSQLLEINQEEIEEWDGGNVKREDVEELEGSLSRPVGLLELALTMKRNKPADDPLEDQESPPRKRSFTSQSTYPTVSIEAQEPLGIEERRTLSQILNSKPRNHCPICGDRANGIHYGIYTCEGCKNFFKRSVVAFNAGKPYVCRGTQNCDISLFEEDGVTRRRTRCQYCRYKACIDAGMLHIGRNGRQIYGQKASQMFHYESASPGGSHLHEEYDQDSSSNHHIEIDNGDEDESEEQGAPNGFLQQQQQIDQLNAERMRGEIELLQSRVRELETTLAEKNRQLGIQRGQISTLQKQCEVYGDMFKGQQQADCCKLLPNGSALHGAPSAAAAYPTVAQFGNGSVTITSIGRRSKLGKDNS